MEMPATSDSELLTQWVEQRRESAFHALVARYATLVHMAAKRTCCDESLAADASQLVFILLAQKAKSLTSHPTLAGWLHITAVMKTRDLVDKSRRESRKLELLQAAMEPQIHSPENIWQEIQPVLDSALAALCSKDRDVLLLRFYRSLTIREIAETLGIATDAAQKRIDRATERLRGKLLKRGCQSGGTLAATLLAGFSADAQAALPVSILASKAIAAGAAGAITSTALFAVVTTTMKSTSFVLPAIALISSAALIAMQRQSIATLERETTLLQNRITASDSSTSLSSTVKPDRPMSKPNGNEPINWKEFVRKYEALKKEGGGRMRSEDMGWVRLIDQRLRSMSEEQLLAELDRIAALNAAPPYGDIMKGMVMTPLSTIAPEFTLMKFMERPPTDTDNWGHPNSALKKWAMINPEKASAWLDTQISAGKLDSKSLDGRNPQRIMFEITLIGVLLASDPDEASRRVSQLPTDQRADVLRGQPVEPENQSAFAKLVRQQVPAPDNTKVLSELAYQSMLKKGYKSASECMERIQVTPEERAACIEHVAVSHFQQLDVITAKEVDALREWTDSISPESTDLLTGKALGQARLRQMFDSITDEVLIGKALGQVRIEEGSQTGFEELGKLAVQYSRASGNDDILVAFLKNPFHYMFYKKEARALAGEIIDDKRRKEVIDFFEAAFPNR